MAAVDILAAFGYKWAETGTVEALDDAQYKAGWAFIGATPPSVEQFNKVHQIADEKANYLYAQMLSVFNAAGEVPSPGDTNSLRDAIAAIYGGGRLINVQTFSANGTYTPTPGTKRIYVRGQAPGGAGGGAPATGAGQVSIGSGGSAGSYGEGWYAVPGAPVTVTAPAGPAGSLGVTGTAGSAASFGSLMTLPGGPGGTAAGPSNPPYPPTGVAGSTLPAGANVLSAGGAPGGTAVAIALNSVVGGVGGVSHLGAGASASVVGVNGVPATSRGGGGGGTAQGPSSAALTGGKGGDAYFIVLEFA